ncbi:MAG TPA: molybdopterin cofactor-binding domain-containing protein [Thermodesulfobacteriota bacterium]|nr:molybdopterin cofactor-binding domain-containing protein [Thermodesulfobacteriota bacterium]
MENYVGKPVPRYDGIGHVTARTTFVDDIRKPGMLHVKVLTSPVHKGRIRRLDVSRAERMPGVAGVVTAKDIPGANAYGLVPDQPVFTPENIRFQGERIAAVAAVDEDAAMEALSRIKLEIEEQEPVFDPREAMKPGAPLVRPEGNVFQFDSGPTRKIRLGEVEKGFREADTIVEGEYTNAMNEHAPMEPQVSLAYIDEADRLAIHTVSQDLYFHLGMLTAIFNLPMNKVRYIGGTVGGGFGAKNDIHCDHVAGVMALKIRKPVKYALTRAEETLYTTKRGAWHFHFKDGVKKDGRIVARRITTLHDTGAYSGMGPYVVDKNSILVGGPFFIPNISIDGSCVYTNKPPASSMRGFGIINGTSAEQLQMDRIAEAIGMDPWEIRFINAWRDGDLGATQFQVVAAGVIEAMKRAAELAGVKLPGHLLAMSSRGR